MFAVLAPNDSLTAVLASAITTTNPTYFAIYRDGNRDFQGTGSLNGTTAATLVAAPSGNSTERLVESLHFYNADTAAVVLTVNKAISGTSYPIAKITLQVGDTLRIDSSGCRVTDANGMSRQIRTGYITQIGTRAKVGTTAGWVVAAADNLPYVATMAASQTGGTLVIPIHGLHVGDTITAYKIIAQVESGGNAVTIDAALRAVTNVAAEPTDASIGAITQVSVTADTAVAAEKAGLSEVVTSGKSYYLLITASTLAATDIILQHPEITVTTAG